MEYTYEQIVNGINEGTIDEVRFSVTIYSHYKNCVLRRVYLNIGGINSFECIEMVLTKDGSERSRYHGPFHDRYRLFNIKGRGRFTLREIFKYVEIKEVVPHK